MADKPGREIKISPVSAPPIQGAANEDEKSLRVPGVVASPIQGTANEEENILRAPAVVAPPVQGTANEEENILRAPAVGAPPVQGAENEPELDFEIPLIDLKETQPGAEDEALRRQAFLFAEAAWVPSADPLAAGPKNLSEMANLRFAEYGLEGVPGYTKINATTALSTYLKIRSGIQLRAPFTTKSRVLVQAYNTGLTASQVLQNITAIPNQGDFEATALHTDAAGAGLGRFAKWPGNQIAYCNGVESKVYGGDEIPCAAFINFDSAGTFFYDFTEKVRNSDTTEVAIFAADTAGGGIDSNVAWLAPLDNDVLDYGPGDHDGTNLNGTFSTTEKKWGTHGWYANGTNARITIANHDDFKFADGTWSYDTWFKPDGVLHEFYYHELPVTRIDFINGDNEVVATDEVHQAATGATGIVLSVTVTGGSWAGNDAAGVIWLGSVTGTWVAGNNMLNVAEGTVAGCDVCGVDENYLRLSGASGTALYIRLRSFGVTTTVATATGLTLTGALHHLEFGESGDNWYIFVDGNPVCTETHANRAEDYTSNIEIAHHYAIAGGWGSGWYDEIRISKICRHTASFTPPVAAYETTGGSGSVGNNYIGSPRPLSAVKFYIQTPNASAAAAQLYYWDGSGEVAVTGQVDGTSAGGKTMSVTGGASISFDTTVGLAKPRYIKGYFLYFYRLQLSGADAATSVYQVTLGAPFQTVCDVWDGTPLLLTSCLRYVAATASYKDYTLAVSEESEEAFADLDALATTEHVLLGSPVSLAGFRIYMSTDAAKVNDNAAAAAIAYCDGGEIDDWPAVSGLSDETAASLKALKQTGVVSFSPVTPGAEYKVSINGGDAQYYYKLTYSAALSASVEVAYIIGIPAPQKIRGYKFPFMFLGRPMLCGYLTGNEGNRVDYGMTHGADVWNGPDSSFGVDNESLYFGGGEDLTAACEVYNRLGSSIYSFAIFTKDYETYILNGYGTGEAPYRIYPVSSVIGCPAALTMDTWQIGISADAQSVRSIAMWLSHQGPVLFDSGGLMPAPGLECYFDRRDSRCVNYAALAEARGWFDPETGDYNLQMPTGSSTVNNVWVALNLKLKKWYPVVPPVAITFANGSHEAVVGEAVHQAVTGATGTVLTVTVASGTWAGGTAAGTILLKETSGTWTAGNNMEDAGHTVIAACTAGTTDPFLGAAFRVYDTAGKGYAYGGRDNGRMMRLHNGVAWDGTATVESFTTADLLVSNDPWDVVRLTRLKLFGISTAEAVNASLVHYADGAASGTALTAAALNGANRIFRSTQTLNLLAWSHRISISAQFATESKGLRLLGWALEYQVERADY